MPKIVFFVCEQMLATSVALPMEQFRAAASFERVQARRSPLSLAFSIASLDGKPVTTHTGIQLMPDAAIESITQADIIFLPALWRNPQHILEKNKAVLNWLNQLYAEGSTIAGVGTGCCFMAEAGLLEHKSATTHWYYFDAFAQRYPNVHLKRNHFITQADKLYCAASVNALADLTVFFIQNWYDEGIARLVERHFFHEVRKAYRMDDETLDMHSDELVAQAQTWLNANAQRSINMEQLALQLGVSTRTLNRRFKNASALTPITYLQNTRMRMAGDLLHASNLAIAEVAEGCGYQDLTHFHKLFRRYYGTSPSQYRLTVRAKLFHA